MGLLWGRVQGRGARSVSKVAIDTAEEGVAGSLSGRGISLDCEVASPGCPLARGRGDRAVLGAPGPWYLLLFQERIFLTVSNYIFTAIFVGEMTLKVAPVFTWDLSHPRGPPSPSCHSPAGQQHSIGAQSTTPLGTSAGLV